MHHSKASDHNPSERLLNLEGLRGLAAVAVVGHHFMCAFYPSLVYGEPGLAHSASETYIYGTPLMFPVAGTFAVILFFILSGFVLSVSYFQKGDINIIKKMATARYLRLMLPALASILIALILIKSGSSSLVNSTAVLTKSVWLDFEWDFSANLINAIYTGTIGIFLFPGTPYNNVLWTMQSEFFGSMMVFMFLVIFGKLKIRFFVYSVLVVATFLLMKLLFIAGHNFSFWLLPFIIGVIIADLYSHNVFNKKFHPLLPITLIIASILLACYPSKPMGTIYEPLQFLNQYAGSSIGTKVFYLTLAGTLMIVSVLMSNKISEILKKFSIIGKYTFSLYLVHLPIIFTFSCGLFLLLKNYMSYNYAVLAVIICSAPLIILASIIFEKYIDSSSISVSKIVSLRILALTRKLKAGVS